ncbi:MAG: hypothetical protein JWO38_7486 [Gemmataceae bacterium]|nr:hypothetical protein [Gemmataceae bacterium]
MLEFLRGRASDRQLRLFACACCRAVQGFIPPGPCRDAVEVSLRYADGQASAEELAAARSAAIAAADHAGAHSAAAWAACEAASPSALQAARAAAEEAAEQVRKLNPRAAEEEVRAQAGFLRDIIGDPFRKDRVESFRRLARDPVVREIAEGVYAGAPQEDMAALADRLEQLGCPSPAVVEHCRSAGPHVRGCWVIDLLLSAEAGPPQASQPAGRATPAWVQEVRAAFAQHLGPKKYRRVLRKAVGSLHGPGQVDCPGEWHAFVQLHPEYDVPDDELVKVFTVCTVHGCELEEGILRGPRDDPALLRDPRFLAARGTRFPHSHPEETDAEWERVVWWCPVCQRARDEWMTGRTSWDAVP